MQPKNKNWIIRLIPSLLSAALLMRASLEVNRVAWGTGEWIGEYSPKWAFGFFGFILASLGLFALTLTWAWSPRKLDSAAGRFGPPARPPGIPPLGVGDWLPARAGLVLPIHLVGRGLHRDGHPPAGLGSVRARAGDSPSVAATSHSSGARRWPPPCSAARSSARPSRWQA